MPSQTAYAVEIGRIEAANNEALKRPNAKSRYAYSPASGRKAIAASAAVSIENLPAEWRVAAHATTMNHATIAAKRQPMMTSSRDARYGRAGRTPPGSDRSGLCR